MPKRKLNDAVDERLHEKVARLETDFKISKLELENQALKEKLKQQQMVDELQQKMAKMEQNQREEREEMEKKLAKLEQNQRKEREEKSALLNQIKQLKNEQQKSFVDRMEKEKQRMEGKLKDELEQYRNQMQQNTVRMVTEQVEKRVEEALRSAMGNWHGKLDKLETDQKQLQQQNAKEVDLLLHLQRTEFCAKIGELDSAIQRRMDIASLAEQQKKIWHKFATTDKFVALLKDRCSKAQQNCLDASACHDGIKITICGPNRSIAHYWHGLECRHSAEKCRNENPKRQSAIAVKIETEMEGGSNDLDPPTNHGKSAKSECHHPIALPLRAIGELDGQQQNKSKWLDNGNEFRTVFAKLSIFDSAVHSADTFYFEITVKAMNRFVAFGLAVKPNAPLDKSLRCRNGTFAWENDGEICVNESAEGGNEMFGDGDTVGCGVNWADQRVFFTKNGRRIDFANDLITTLSSSVDKMFPFVSMAFFHCQIEANFGPEFVYNLSALPTE